MTSEEYYMAAGSESGVVSLYNMNLSSSAGGNDALGSVGSVGVKRKSALIGVSGLRPPVVSAEAHKAVMNLTTKVTSIAMHPAGQLMAIASDQKRDQLRLVHLPSGSVFENWPTAQTPVRRVQCLEFSPSMDVLAVGNNRGRVVMYKIGHYASSRDPRGEEGEGAQ
jgi:WD40 repeat protein